MLKKLTENAVTYKFISERENKLFSNRFCMKNWDSQTSNEFSFIAHTWQSLRMTTYVENNLNDKD